MAVVDRVRELVAPVVADVGAELYDVEFNGGILRILVDADGGIDIDAIKTISKSSSRVLDEADPIPGRYTLEVSSRVSSVRSAPACTTSGRSRDREDQDVRRRRRQPPLGTLVGSTEAGFTLEIDGDTRAFAYDDVAKARTVFEWGGAPSPARATSVRASQNRREAH